MFILKLKNENMKKVTRYECEDGLLFKTKREAKIYEWACENCREIEYSLVNIDGDLHLGEYIQQVPETVQDAFDKFVKMLMIFMTFCRWTELSITGIRKHLSDTIYAHGYIYDFAKRLCNIDFKNGKEFQQPYYLEHQEEATKEVKGKVYKKESVNNKELTHKYVYIFKMLALFVILYCSMSLCEWDALWLLHHDVFEVILFVMMFILYAIAYYITLCKSK